MIFRNVSALMLAATLGVGAGLTVTSPADARGRACGWRAHYSCHRGCVAPVVASDYVAAPVVATDYVVPRRTCNTGCAAPTAYGYGPGWGGWGGYGGWGGVWGGGGLLGGLLPF